MAISEKKLQESSFLRHARSLSTTRRQKIPQIFSAIIIVVENAYWYRATSHALQVLPLIHEPWGDVTTTNKAVAINQL
jgi:hypothetical protein